MFKRFILSVLFLTSVAHAGIKTQTIVYKDGKTVLEGYLAMPDTAGAARPGVLVVHEWRGHGEYARSRARQLAELGYVAFAVDMYGKGVYAKDHDEAGKLSGVFFNDRALMRRRVLSGLAQLKGVAGVDVKRLAAIGYCFGGTTVLELARSGADVRGVASFHGNLTTPTPAAEGAVKAKVLVLHGASDAWTAGALPDFEKEMNAARADWQLISYGGAVHSFTVKDAGDDPSKGMAYNAAADRRSWSALQTFLGELFVL